MAMEVIIKFGIWGYCSPIFIRYQIPLNCIPNYYNQLMVISSNFQIYRKIKFLRESLQFLMINTISPQDNYCTLLRLAETFIPYITVEVILKGNWETLEQILSIQNLSH